MTPNNCCMQAYMLFSIIQHLDSWLDIELPPMKSILFEMASQNPNSCFIPASRRLILQSASSEGSDMNSAYSS